MKREPQVPQGTIALLAVYALIVVFLWSNVYFTMRSRGANTPVSSLAAPSTTVLALHQETDMLTLKETAL